METLNLKAYMIGESLNLKKIAGFFNRQPEKGRHFLLLEDELSSLLKTARKKERVYLFSFGSIVFVDFNETDIRNFLAFLQSLGQPVQGKDFLKYVEEYRLQVDPAAEPAFTLEEGVIPAVDSSYLSALSTAMANSLFFAKVEDDADVLFDHSGSLLARIRRGQFFFSRVYLKNIGGYLRFQLHSVYHANPVKFALAFKEDDFSKELYTRFSQLYALEERYQAIRKKAENLERVIRSFNELAYHKQEYLAYLIEGFLLFSFLIMDLIYYYSG